MSENSKIEWTDHTFNPWWGCTKVSPACQNCYAETWSKRTGHQVWGNNSKRRFLSEDQWKLPLKWNKSAEADGVRRKVFCASMADVFDEREDLEPWRERLWDLIKQTPNLDWLLLTKRPENIASMSPWGNDWPDNVWMGTTVENQEYADKRIPILLSFPAKVRFLSCEPLLGPVNLKPYLKGFENQIDWVITGGESGPGSRPTSIDWFRSLRDQCILNSVSYHFKQWGHWIPEEFVEEHHNKVVTFEGHCMVALGKGRSGRILDGQTWDQFPLLSRVY